LLELDGDRRRVRVKWFESKGVFEEIRELIEIRVGSRTADGGIGKLGGIEAQLLPGGEGGSPGAGKY
jgi:hypothetical protein